MDPSKSLVDRIKEDDVAAFELLFRNHYADIVRFVRRYVADKAAAEEVAQDVFVTVWEKRKQWAVRNSVRAYLYGAARNRALNVLRDSRRHEEFRHDVETIAVSHDATADDILHAKNLSEAIIVATRSLPERSRTIFLLHRQEGLTYPEIASLLKISVNTVETQMGRALKSLRRMLSDFLP